MTRRRGAELEAAIADAALAVLVQRGAAGVTMEAVAAAAGTSKAVLYRRWPDSAALLRAALLGVAQAAIPTADTGSYRGDMLAVLDGWVNVFTGPRAALMRAAVGAMAQDPELAETFRSGVIDWRKHEMDELLRRGMARGDVRADVPVELARELGQSVLWHRLLITGDPISRELALRLVDDVLVPFVSPPTTAGS
ncbi:TetR/AcrR family transcriptional regulator [Mycolicibacterium brumae]|uniref:TetR family transcriptional regulator n=1 Tax=Mycolicibacterium brumae TaxID=85968 RepID=A0A2G5P9P3_9MYCO|nr:TetR/AcrR family transcriptional regulator [Mycolicibacterium brumae]MCV7193665.1 TetR/AcrR family transcriptional regulator [Mycolicibacterium brumae]PIB75055.1 TetR family transcriptional regulator [Mycolicibacterium brumae]RWA17364.1 hypothetical protein MBRU_06980 [Mycolicibacterium brumae DSM 44177]UWW09062.1 TetR/AcrR family transcriptional regulator [Mycolicibacterium brumae]